MLLFRVSVSILLLAFVGITVLPISTFADGAIGSNTSTLDDITPEFITSTSPVLTTRTAETETEDDTLKSADTHPIDIANNGDINNNNLDNTNNTNNNDISIANNDVSLVPTMYFNPSTIGEIAKLTLTIPRIGVQFSRGSFIELKLPTGMLQSELSKTPCTISAGGLQNAPLTTSAGTRVDVDYLRFTYTRTVNSDQAVVIICPGLTVPDSIRNPASYETGVYDSSGGVLIKFVTRLLGSTPRLDPDIPLKRIIASHYLNDTRLERKGILTASYTAINSDLAAGVEFRISYPEGTVFGSGVSCNVNKVPSNYALLPEERLLRVVLSNTLYKSNVLKNTYTVTCTNIQFDNKYIAPNNENTLNLLNGYEDALSVSSEAYSNEITISLSSPPNSENNSPGMNNYDVQVITDLRTQLVDTGITISVNLYSYGLAKGDFITLMIDSSYTMGFRSETKCTLNSVSAGIVSLPNLHDNRIAVNRNLTIASPLNLSDRDQRAMIYCFPVANPMSSSNSGTAYVEVVDSRSWAKLAQSSEFLMPEVEFAIIGSKIATLVPQNTTARSEPGILTLSLSPIPFEIPARSTIMFNLPRTWSLADGVILSSSTCRVSTTSSDPRNANIRGYTTYNTRDMIIDFSPSESIPKLNDVLRIFCDGVSVSEQGELGRDDLSVYVRYDGKLLMQNDKVTSSTITDKYAPTAYLSHWTMFYRENPLSQSQITKFEDIYIKQIGLPRENVRLHKQQLYQENDNGSLEPYGDAMEENIYAANIGPYGPLVHSPISVVEAGNDGTDANNEISMNMNVNVNADDGNGDKKSLLPLAHVIGHGREPILNKNAFLAINELDAAHMELDNSQTGEGDSSASLKNSETKDMSNTSVDNEFTTKGTTTKKRLQLITYLRPTASKPFDVLNRTLYEYNNAILRDIKRDFNTIDTQAPVIVQISLPVHCFNSIADNGESGVDCGGPCSGCYVGQECDSNGDCLSSFCSSTYFCRENPDSDSNSTSKATAILGSLDNSRELMILYTFSIIVGILTTYYMTVYQQFDLLE